MNWIAAWCADRCEDDRKCIDCYELNCAPRASIVQAAKCSEYLLWILMNEQGAVTHPNIANAIADFTGATAEQRDQIVHKKHHGTWQPDPKRVIREIPVTKERYCGQKPVLAIDRLGNVIERFPALKLAAARVGCTVGTISNRCNGVRFGKDEFVPFGMSFRFEDDWLRLTEEERIEDIQKRSMRT